MIAMRYRLTVVVAAAVLAACGSSGGYGSSTATTAAGAGAATSATSAAATPATPATTADSGGYYGGGGGGDTTVAPASTAASTGGASLALASIMSFGPALVDAKGMSLYLFTKDGAGTSACTGTCAANWPPAVATGTPTAGTGLDAGKMSTIMRADGATQLAYNGHPLYTFAADAAPGQAAGQGSNGVWFLVNAAGNQIG